MSPCPGKCNSEYRKTVAAGDLHAELEAHVTHGDPVWCHADAGIVRQALRMMPLAHQALEAVHLMTRDTPERVSGSRNPPSPSPGFDAQDEMVRVLTSWEDDLRCWRKYNHPTPGPPRAGAGRDQAYPLLTLEVAVVYLNAGFHVMMEREECAADFGREIVSLFTRAQGMVKNGPTRRRLPFPCPACDFMTLVQEEGVAGKPWYVCCDTRPGGCGRLYTPEEWEWWIQIQTAAAKS